MDNGISLTFRGLLALHARRIEIIAQKNRIVLARTKHDHVSAGVGFICGN